MPRANPRVECLRALLRWENGTEFADDILHQTLARTGLPPLDRALLTELFYGILRNRTLLDFWISLWREEALDLETRTIVRMGLYQLLKLRTPPHAAVNETVKLARRSGGLVNALLRRAGREGERLEEETNAAPLHVRFSHPEHLVERWRQQFGEINTEKLCAWNNQPAEVYVRANTLKVTLGELLRTTEHAHSHAHPLMLKVRHVPLPWIMQGLCYVQDPSTLLACELLAPQPGERVLDACAAPGGKTSYLAQLMGNRGQITACDVSRARLERLQLNLTRLSVSNAELREVNWLEPAAAGLAPESYDAILLDAPCTNTGVLRRRVDARWRLSPGDFAAMPDRQLALAKAVVPFLRKRGRLVYSTCSLDRSENEAVVARVVSGLAGLRMVREESTLPFRDGVDGAFAAVLVKA